MNNTMNFNSKGYCDVDRNSTNPTVSKKINSNKWQTNQWYNNRAACETAGFAWYEVSHIDNLYLANNSFVCAKTQFSRVNQLGNALSDTVISQSAPASAGVVSSHVTENLNANRFLWTIPQIPKTRKGSAYFSSMETAYQSCVLRVRYNISSADFQPWPIGAVDSGTARMVDYHNNSLTTTDTRTPLHQDPYVYIGAGDSSSKSDKFVKLKVNTNQYSRTFQDRSYVFSIKPLPTASKAADNEADTPEIDYTSIKTALQNGGKIYNVNVRGKRGNIVQVYPSVEYDFVPNALALSKYDMIHFQWTGSDYNPRRGCNDGQGGPPDLNTYSTDANANQNPRADRSNVVLTYHMGYNVPMDYLGFDHNNQNLTYAQKVSTAKATVLENAPCYDPATDSAATATQCYNTIMRLAYLNQQSDVGSLSLRGSKACLTQTQLDAIASNDVADFHPLNCAKLNAKPYPYFDGGILFTKKSGWFPYFSSRNNNFSNRQQIGVICIGSSCKVDNSTGVLQDSNPNTNGKSMVNAATSNCHDTATASNAAHSCLPTTTTAAANAVLTTETSSKTEGDNDAQGDGNAKGCAGFPIFGNASTVEQNVAIAFICLSAGLFFSWLAYYLYNRYQARRAGESKFRYDTAWQKAEPIEQKAPKARPASSTYTEINPGVKVTRPTTSPKPLKTPKSSGNSIKRTEMI